MNHHLGSRVRSRWDFRQPSRGCRLAEASTVKITGQNHQFLGGNNAITSILAARTPGHGRGGVFWRRQGSGGQLANCSMPAKVRRRSAQNYQPGELGTKPTFEKA